MKHKNEAINRRNTKFSSETQVASKTTSNMDTVYVLFEEKLEFVILETQTVALHNW